MIENIQKLLSKVDAQYVQKYVNYCKSLDDILNEDLNNLTMCINLKNCKTLVGVIELDLLDKGFTAKEIKEITQEIDEIVKTDFSKETMYKYISYCVSLVNEYNSYEEFLDIIKEEYDEWVSEDTFNIIFKYYNSLL